VHLLQASPACVFHLIIYFQRIGLQSLQCMSAVLSLQRYGLAGIWAPVFALSIMLVLCLDVLVAIAHVFDMLAPRQPKVLPILCELMVVVVCAGLGIFIQERYQNRPANLMSLHR